MLEIDPAWAGGHPYYAWGFYDSNIPRILGGNLREAEEFIDKAVEAGPKWLYASLERARYVYTEDSLDHGHVDHQSEASCRSLGSHHQESSSAREDARQRLSSALS